MYIGRHAGLCRLHKGGWGGVPTHREGLSVWPLETAGGVGENRAGDWICPHQHVLYSVTVTATWNRIIQAAYGRNAFVLA